MTRSFTLTEKARSGLPIYRQLYIALRSLIVEGHLEAGESFPTEPKLALRYGVSRVSVRRALAMLEAENLIERKRGAGTFVKAPQGGTPGPIKGDIDNLISIGAGTSAELLCFEMRPAPARVRQALSLDGPALALERLRRHKGAPVSFTTVWIPPVFGPLLDQAPISSTPVIQLLEDKGVAAQTTDQTISATVADDRVSSLLEVNLGNPLIVLTRSVYGPENDPILHQRSLYPPERYEYHMTLSRDVTGGHSRWRHKN